MTILDDTPETPKPSKPQLTEQERTIRFVGRTIATAILLIFLMVTSCTMHSNTFDAARLVEEAKIVKLENENSLVIQKTKRDLTTKMTTLIENGANPIAVRCAFVRQTTNASIAACNRLGLLFPKVETEFAE